MGGLLRHASFGDTFEVKTFARWWLRDLS